MKYQKAITLFLGVSMFMFGFLKFFNPFKAWYTVQISTSQLGKLAYVVGIVGELIIGIILFSTVIFQNKFMKSGKGVLTIFASVMVMIIMITGSYVHLHPDVPAEVLPLKIKPPYIPLFFFITALVNVVILFPFKKNTHHEAAV